MTNALHAEIRSFILKAIEDGEISPGDAVSDQFAARALGVSRTPVRAVLEALDIEGVVKRVEGRGWRVVAVPRNRHRKKKEETLYSRILNAKVKGTLDEEVFENELMLLYGESRAEVKRAMEHLSTDGLVERRRGHGWRFTEALSSVNAWNESYVFRELLECGALDHPNWNDRPEERKILVDRHSKILKCPRGKVDPTEWFETNSRFHEYIAAGLDNSFVSSALAHQNRLRRLWEFASFTELDPERIQQSCEEHLAIMTAIEEGDRDLAVALLRRHLRLAATN